MPLPSPPSPVSEPRVVRVPRPAPLGRPRVAPAARGEPDPLGRQLRHHQPGRRGGLPRPAGRVQASTVQAEIPLDPAFFRTGYHWHVRVSGLPDEFCYGYRVDGPKGPGDKFNPDVILIDPACRALSCGAPSGRRGEALPRLSLMTTRRTAEGYDFLSLRRAPPHPSPRHDPLRAARPGVHGRSVVGRPQPPGRHLRRPGREDPPIFKALGITAVELLPVHEFDENDCTFVNPMTGERSSAQLLGIQHDRLRGDEVGSMAAGRPPPSPWKSSAGPSGPSTRPGSRLRARRRLQLHTAEAGEDGPTYSFRGLDNRLYYMLDHRGRYLNFTGCVQHGEHEPPDRPGPGPLLSAEHGRRERRRWLPVRPRLGPRAR